MPNINLSLDYTSRKAKNSLKRGGGHRGSSTFKSRNTSFQKTRSNKEQVLSSTTLPRSSRIPEDKIKVIRNTNPTANDTVNPLLHIVESIKEQKHHDDAAETESPFAVWVEYYLSRLPFSSGEEHHNRSKQEAAVHIISAQLERLVPDVMNMLNVQEGIHYANRIIDLGKSLVVLGETIQEVGESWTNDKID